MDKIKILILILFTSGILFSQKVTEKQLTGIPTSVAANGYDVKYDKKTGAYVYPAYDTISDGVIIVTSKGKSAKYDGANTYSSVFDDDGNAYTLVFNRKDDTTNVYTILRNGVSVGGTFEFVNDNWAVSGHGLYFASKEGSKSYYNILDVSTAQITKSKPYDDIVLTYIPEIFRNSHGERITYPGFTSDHKPYYIAYKDSTEVFMVIDGVEQKHYSDIDFSFCTPDSRGNLFYVAAGKGRIYDDKADVFVVNGTTEYKHFNYIYGEITFDKSGSPVYNAGISDDKGRYPQVLMSGNNEISKWYDGGISNYIIMPSGKPAFLGSKYVNEKDVVSFVVIDGKEGKKFESGYNLQLKPNGEPIFIVLSGNKQHLVVNDEKASDNFDNIIFSKYSGGKLFYAGTNYASDPKKSSDQTFVFIGNKKLGPFNAVPSEDNTADGFFTVDDAGNYILIGTILKSNKDFDYESYVYTKSGKSGPYNGVSDFYIYKGRPIFVSYMYPDKKTPGSTSRVNIDMKDVTGDYDVISDFSLDAVAGKISFVGSRQGKIYYVEIAL